MKKTKETKITSSRGSSKEHMDGVNRSDQQARLKNTQAQQEAECCEHNSKEDKKEVKSGGTAVIIATLLSLITVPLVILLSLPAYPIFTEADNENHEETSFSRRLC